MTGVMKEVEKAVLEAFVVAPLKEGISNMARGALSGGGNGGLWGGVAKGVTSLFGFADGGIVNTPTFFPLGEGNAGVAGERGTEIIAPAVRGPDGTLGVKVHGENRPKNVTVNMTVMTPNADSFRRSDRQIAYDMKRRMG
jgi:phage-related minor tail protein